ncbi:MAG TPA: DNA ligase D [Rhodanobacteraceae bacterium]|nr:DNA ligase D [Rhodanobacteraceae bacterium]
MNLRAYSRKRDFQQTPEPAGRQRGSGQRPIFVVQLHHARRRHYDFRLQVGDVLKSWAVPKGPSFDPAVKRLAVEVEDHPLDYANFEGTIPEGHYGAGDVALFDRGLWSTRGDPVAQLAKGHLAFELSGQRLHGAWHLVRTHRAGAQPQWLLIKDEDAEAGHVEADDLLPSAKGQTGGKATKPASVGKRRSRRKRDWSARARALEGAKSGRLRQEPFAPELARLRDAPPASDDWLHETKWDGYRILATVVDGSVRLWSRNALDWTAKLPEIASAVEALRLDTAALDGEVIAGNGAPQDFGLLQATLSGERQEPLSFVLFDLLHLAGQDLTGAPLEARKALLEQVLADPPAHLAYSSHVLGHGEQAFDHAVKHGLEGVVSKRRASPYRAGRGDDWTKSKRRESDEFAVVGFTAPKGSRGGFGSLLLARPDPKGGWAYVGRVGSGFSDEQLRTLGKALQARTASTKPTARLPGAATPPRGATWFEPQLVAEVFYRGIGNQGLLRQPSLKTLREDKRPDDLRPKGTAAPPTQEQAMPRQHITHAERIVYPSAGVTKGEVADYYRAVMDWLLPGITGRPLSIIRCPDGADDACFFQKHHGAGLDKVATARLKEESGRAANYLVATDAESVMQLVQMNTLEFHPWGALAEDPDNADRIVIDLDPDPEVAWAEVKRAARLIHDHLEQLGLRSFLRATGGKGLHVVVPLRPASPWPQVKNFTRAFAETLAASEPQRFIAVADKKRRRGKIFVDYLRNARGATSVASYSLRARPNASVAVPLRWDELSRLKRADAWDLRSLPRRLARLKADPWAGMDTLEQSLGDIDIGD